MPTLYGLSGKLGPPSNTNAEQLAASEAEREKQRELLALAGRAHWHVAHTHRHWTPETFQQWRDAIPSFGCSCKRDAEEYIEANPPPLGDDDKAFVWFVSFHNAINRKLDKPEVGLDTARELYKNAAHR